MTTMVRMITDRSSSRGARRGGRDAAHDVEDAVRLSTSPASYNQDAFRIMMIRNQHEYEMFSLFYDSFVFRDSNRWFGILVRDFNHFSYTILIAYNSRWDDFRNLLIYDCILIACRLIVSCFNSASILLLSCLYPDCVLLLSC